MLLENTIYKDSTLYVGATEICSNSSNKYYFANGYVDLSGNGRVNGFCYFAKDHLGNVRHVDYTCSGRNNGIVQITNYYPFGGILNESFTRLDYQNKLYNGKELDRMHGQNLYDYSARQYDAALGQFTSMDPLCEKYYHISPYAYCAGNPVKYVDPDGRDYRVRYDGENVIIEVDYYVSSTLSGKYKSEVQNSINELNKYSEKNWKYKDADGNKYNIRVELKMTEISPEDFATKEKSFVEKDGLSSSYEGNIIIFGSIDQGNQIAYDDKEEKTDGDTRNGRIITIDENQKESMTIRHEIGHTLGLNHDSSGLMTASSNDPMREDGFLVKKDFVKIINHAGMKARIPAKGYLK